MSQPSPLSALAAPQTNLSRVGRIVCNVLLRLQSWGLADRRSCAAFLSKKYENESSKAAAAPNAKATHSAATLPTDQDNIAARPQRNPLGRQTQAIRRVRVSPTEARTGLCFVLHHNGYRIPILTANDATISNIGSGERPTAIKIAGNGRSARTTRPNREFRRRRCCSYSRQLTSIAPIVEVPLSS
jgi:hypothetical protein